MVEQNRQLDDFFHIASRFTIVFPIIVVIVAVFLKLNGSISQQKGFKEYGFSPTPTKSQSLLENLNTDKKSSPSAHFNLKGPLSCSFTANSTAINVYVKDKKISIKMDEKKIISNYLLNGDCVYIWKNGIYSGEKICGISQQVSLAEGLLSSGLIDPNTIFSNLGQFFNLPTVGNSKDVLKSAMKSCKSEAIPSSIRFEIPKNILFKNKNLR